MSPRPSSRRSATAIVTAVLFAALLGCEEVASRGVPIPDIFKQAQSPVESKGLYQDAPYVVSMNSESLPHHIYNRPHASYVEFYNSYCGFCKRFAPHWKQFSEEVQAWRDVVQIGAVDCSSDENGEVCRQYEVMAYPTLRYIPPQYANTVADVLQIGYRVATSNHELVKPMLIDYLLNETNPQPHWPNLAPYNETTADRLFAGSAASAKLAFLVVVEPEGERNTTGLEIILDLHATKEAVIRWTAATHLPFLPANANPKPWVYAVARHSSVVDNVLTPPLDGDKLNKSRIVARMTSYMRMHGIAVVASSTMAAIPAQPDNPVPEETMPEHMQKEQQDEIKERVKKMKDTVFRADLEMALRYALFHEIPGYAKIDGERFTALKQFLAVIRRYFPFGGNGQQFIRKLQDYVMTNDVSISGASFDEAVKRLEAKYRPVFSSSRWVGCYSDNVALRRFPCSMWVMFHHLTVAAEEAEMSTDPLEVLQAMHGYVKYFFGCTDCSQHFQQMAKDNRLWSVSSKDNAILWLWAAHNQVNKRLSGDETEDPEFPKQQFPSRAVCPQCYRDTASSSGLSFNNGSEWDKTEVLFFLKRIHATQNISILGVENELALPAVAEQLTAQRVMGGVLNDNDFRLGVLLYVVSVAMIVVAVKMFVKRKGWGYRKKMYVHDLLGKV